MEVISDGCRLCLDPFTENACSIESPELKEQMSEVFHFPITSEEGYPKKVCQSCAYTISEFYQYAEKVRRNQEQLHLTTHAEPAANSEPECKLEIEEIKVEPIVQRVSPRRCKDQSSGSVEPKEESADVSDEATGTEIFAEPCEPVVSEPRKTQKNCTRAKRKCTEEILDSDEDKLKPRKKINILTKKEREKREQTILDFYSMVCELCGYQGLNFADLDSHFIDKHNRTGYVICCEKKLFTRRYMIQHLSLHENPSAFRCELCKKNYKCKDYLLMHQRKIHGSDEDRPFKCDHPRCTQSFTKPFLLKAHMASHEKAKCPQCDRLLASKSALKAHILNMHSDVDRKMICDTCGQEFLNKASFERHVNEHKGIEVVKKFQCQICSKWLTGERGLQNHLQYTHHDKTKYYTCEICHQQYPNSRAVWRHKQVVHCEEKYECEFCGKKFKQKLAWKEHRTIHTGEVLYSCDICGVTKNSKANLYVHIKKNHYTEWLQKQLKTAQPNVPNSN